MSSQPIRRRIFDELSFNQKAAGVRACRAEEPVRLLEGETPVWMVTLSLIYQESR